MYKGLFAIILSLICVGANAQLGRSTKSRSQLWLGMLGGVNQTQATPLNRYSIIESTNGETNEKNYLNKGYLGNQLGVLFTYDVFAGIALSLQPRIVNYSFAYESEYEWVDDANSFNDFLVNYTHENKLQYLQIPFFIKYDVISSNFGFGRRKKNMLKPFVQAGGAYSYLLQSQKKVTETGVNNLQDYEKSPYALDVSNQFINSEWQAIVGGGLNVDINSFRFAAVFNYHWGLNNVIDKDQRYSNLQQNTDSYDVYDNVNLRGWTASIHAIFPLKFIYDPHFKKSH